MSSAVIDATPPRRGFWARAGRHKSFAVGAVLSAALVAVALLSLLWTPYPVADIDIPNKLAPPSATHWLGTDSLGRDIASQLMVGAQNSIVVGVVAVGIGLVIGVALGCAAAAAQAAGRNGYDELVMRASDFQTQMFQAPMLAVWPGTAIMLSVLGLNLMGDGLRDLLDPRLSRSR